MASTAAPAPTLLLLLPPMLLLLLLLLLLTPSAAAATDEKVPSVYAFTGEKVPFDCVYDRAKDTRSLRQELGMTVQDCNQKMEFANEPDEFHLIAAVLGKDSADTLKMYEKYFQPNDKKPPIYHQDSNHKMVKNGSVEIVEGNINRIRVKVRAQDHTNGLCLFCGQRTQKGTGYTVSKSKLVVVDAPSIKAKWNRNQNVTNSSRFEVEEGKHIYALCFGEAPMPMRVRLSRDGKTLNDTGKDPYYFVSKATYKHSGNYRCDVNSELEFLKQRNQATASKEFVVAVLFRPKFELSEIVKYTKLNQKAEILVTVSAYPEPTLTCSPAQTGGGVTQHESFNDKDFKKVFKVIYSNLDRVTKETRINCTAENVLGQSSVSIVLQANAPVPNITSGPDTDWHNSYSLHWQHHAEADVDEYVVSIVDNSGKATRNVTVKNDDSRLKTSVEAGNNKLHKYMLYNLTADAEHTILLHACNAHGCSDASGPVLVRTKVESGSTYNDPSKVSTDPNAANNEKKKRDKSTDVDNSACSERQQLFISLRFSFVIFAAPLRLL